MKCFWAFSTFAIGGPQRRFATLATALGPEFHHTVSAMDGCYDAETLLTKDVAYERQQVVVKKSGFLSRRNINLFRSVLSDVQPDLLLTSNWGAIEWRLANRKAKIPHIHFEDGFGPDETGGKRSWKRDIARRVLFSRTLTGHERYAFVAPSTGLADIMRRVWRAPLGKTHLVPNGVDVDRFRVLHRDPSVNRPIVIGAVGAFREEKRLDRLIRILDIVREKYDARLLLVGDGPERRILEEAVTARGLNSCVEFAGAQEDVEPFLNMMDIYAIPSDTEQMPISLVEAMSAGLPVVGSDVGDIKIMLAEDNRQFIHAPQDEAAMTKSMSRLIADGAARARLGAANMEKATNAYSLETMTKRYRDLFQALAVNA